MKLVAALVRAWSGARRATDSRPQLRGGAQKGWFFSRLFRDGVALPRAVSSPDDNWRAWPVCELGDDPETEIRTPPGILPRGDDGRHAVLNFMPTPYTRWSNALSPVLAFDKRRRRVRHAGFPLPRPEQTRRVPFRLENVISGLREPGRWYLDSTAGRVYLWPPEGEPPDDFRVTAPFLTELVDIEGDPAHGVPVRYLRLRGLSFRHARLADGPAMAGLGAPGAAVCLNGVEDSLIQDCRFGRLGGNAVRAGPDLQRVTIRRCDVSEAGGAGIAVRGRVGAPPFPCTGNRVEDCHVHHCGQLYWHSSGISVGAAERTVVAHNLVHDMPYVGIAAGGGPRHTYYRGWPRRFPELEALWRKHGDGDPTIDNVKRFTPGRNRIQKNVVHHVMQILDDGAAIYCHAGHREAVRHNVVYAVQSPMGMGLYFDDEQMDSVMEGNLVYQCPLEGHLDAHSAAIHLHHNGRHRIVNNVLVGGRQVLSIPSGYGGHRIERNVFVWAGEPDLARADPAVVRGAGDGRRQQGWDAGVSIVRANLWWAPKGRRTAARLLAAWQRRGYGAGSLAVNPLFCDPSRHDYRLRSQSPAFALGFRPLRVNDAGPR